MHTTRDEEPHTLTVNLVSETVDGSKGHGVHTAFLQTRAALESAGVDVHVNDGPGCDIVHIETMGLRSLRLLLRTRERALVTAHVVPESLVGSFMLAPLWLPIARLYMRTFYSLADEVLAVSPDVVEGLERMQLTSPVRFVPNAIDVERFAPQPGWREETRERLGIASDAFVVICAGQVQPRKGIDAFIEAARALPEVTFLWVGGMPFKRLTAHYRGMLHSVASAPSNCRFIGEVPYDEIPRHLAAADCMFFPSWQETFGLAIIEAAAAGLPLVLRDLSTYRPLFDGAYLAGDETTFVRQVAELRADEALRARYVKRSRDLAARYGAVRHAQQLFDAYDDVLARAEGERSHTARRLRPVLTWALSGRSHRR